MRKLLDELRLLGATTGRAVISSNIPTRQDGHPYADASRYVIRDPGVAVYFDVAGDAHVMARDLYTSPAKNMHALALAIEAMRAIERHGGDFMMKRAFSGFSALPPPTTAPPWHVVLGVSITATINEINSAYRALALRAHPDNGGSHEQMASLNAARGAALAQRTIA